MRRANPLEGEVTWKSWEKCDTMNLMWRPSEGEICGMPDVVSLGDVNIDIIARFPSYPAEGQDALATSMEFHCGGSAANSAMALARMGFDVSLISRVGVDPLVSKALDDLAQAGVRSDSLQRDLTVATGLMYVIVTSSGERTILGHRGANVCTDPHQIREEIIREARLFHLSGYALLADPQRSAALLALEMACRHGLTVSLDPGLAVSQSALDEMYALLPVVDILLPNLAEAQKLTGLSDSIDCARSLSEAGAGLVALKLGREGCLVSSDQGVTHVPGFRVRACDSTGAGDYFAAGLVAGFLGALTWCGAAVLANAMGAAAVARVGAGASVPRAREVLDLLLDHLDRVAGSEEAAPIAEAVTYVRKLAVQPAEEGKRWWT
jgi:ribokinase